MGDDQSQRYQPGTKDKVDGATPLQRNKKRMKLEAVKSAAQLFPRGVIVGLTAAKTARYVSVGLAEREKVEKERPQLILNDTAQLAE